MFWQEASTLGGYPYNQIMFNDSELFFISTESASPYNLQMYKITFSITSVNWANKISWPTASWNSDWGETLLSSDGQLLFALFLYGDSSSMFTHLAVINSTNGSVVGTRYILNTSSTFIDAFIQFDIYLVASIRLPSGNLIAVFNINLSQIQISTISFFSSSSLSFILGLAKDPNYSR